MWHVTSWACEILPQIDHEVFGTAMLFSKNQFRLLDDYINELKIKSRIETHQIPGAMLEKKLPKYRSETDAYGDREI